MVECVLVVEDHTLVRSGLKALLKDLFPEIKVLEAENLQQARILAEWAEHIFLDISLPDGSGLTLLPELASHKKITILTAHDSPAFQHRAMNMGATGFLSKNAKPDELQKALAGTLDAPKIRSHGRLTPKETEILLLMGEGLQAKEIYSKLGVDSKTMYTHRRHIRQKLNLKDNAQLLHYAYVYFLSLKK